ncbi:unnamed protein product, partial [Sphacelaria rigidula]
PFSQPALDFLESAHMLWDNTVNKAYRVKGEIQPLQNAAADGVRKDVTAFGEEVLQTKSCDNISRFRPIAAPCDGLCRLDKVQSSLRELEAKAASMRELEELFELSPAR